MFVKILKAFKYVRLLEQEIDDLNEEIKKLDDENADFYGHNRILIAEANEKDAIIERISEQAGEAIEKSEHYRALLIALISKPHMGMKKKGTVRYTIQDSEMDEALDLELIEENNFPSRSTTIYARRK